MKKLEDFQFRRLIPVDSLPEKSQREIMKHADLQQLKRGLTVFRSGDNDDFFVYVLEGALELAGSDGKQIIIDATSEDARAPLSNLKPRRYRARVHSDTATVLKLPGDIVENLLAMAEAPALFDDAPEMIEVYEFRKPDSQDWAVALLSTAAFRRLPAGNISNLLAAFEEIHLRAGQTVIHYGETGDYYYVVRKGRCRVYRPTDAGQVELAEIGELQGFGEEALISNRPRNASVEMITDGVLMRLSQRDFDRLLKQPLIRQVDLKQTRQLMKDGAFKIDVRTENEYARSGIKGSINIPLHLLRSKGRILDHNKAYLLFCNNGVRSQAASFILASMGYDTYVVKGGLNALIAERDRHAHAQDRDGDARDD